MRRGTPRWRPPSTGATACSTDRAIPAPPPQRVPVVVRHRRCRSVRPRTAEHLRPSPCSASSSTRASSCACPARVATGCSRRSAHLRQGPPRRSGRDGADASSGTGSHVRERIGSASRLDRWLSARLGALYPQRSGGRAAGVPAQPVEHGHVADAVEIAIGASFLWRRPSVAAEGDDVDCRPPRSASSSIDDQLWVHILRADVGQGRGDHRQMFGAAAAAAGLIGSAGDVAGSCVAAALRGAGAPHRRRSGQTASRAPPSSSRTSPATCASSP